MPQQNICSTPKLRSWLVLVSVSCGLPLTSISSQARFACSPVSIWYRQRNIDALKRAGSFGIVRDAPCFKWFQSLLSDIEAAQTDRQCHIVFMDTMS
jgi:hypothetical protein